MDVRLDYGGSKICLLEVKPCGQSTVQFAVREAIGQLLEYRHRHAPKAKLAVVLGIQPGSETLSLLKSLTIDAMWKHGHGFEGSFKIA